MLISMLESHLDESREAYKSKLAEIVTHAQVNM